MAFVWASRICRVNLQKTLGVTGNWSTSLVVQKQITRTPLLLANQPSICTSQKTLSEVQHSAHNHTPIWTAERALSASLLGILPVAFFFPNTALDYVAALALTAHVHWGVEAIVADYVRPSVVGPVVARAALAGVYFFSILTLGGLFYFNYSDVGLMQAIRMLWKL